MELPATKAFEGTTQLETPSPFQTQVKTIRLKSCGKTNPAACTTFQLLRFDWPLDRLNLVSGFWRKNLTIALGKFNFDFPNAN